MIKLSVAIMGHPKRQKNIDRILEVLNDDRVKVSLDTESRGCWWNAKRAWGMYDKDSSHHLVIQDDVMPCKKFIETAEKALKYNPANLVSFFSIYKLADKATEENHSWYTSSKGWGQALCMPTGWIDVYLEWCGENIRAGYDADDARFSAFAISHGLKVWNTNPSLVEHIEANNSIIGNNPPIDRTARNLIDKDPELIDWKMPKKPFHNPAYLGEYKNIFKETI